MMNLPDTLSDPWPPYVERIAKWLGEHEWLDQDTFDALARDARVEARPYDRRAMILPFSGGVSCFIAAIQEMARNGLVEARERGGKVEYRLREAA